MYTKEELEKLSIPELLEIASELGVKVSQNDELENVIYAILDKAAENSAAGVSETKRKRTRIAKKDDKVYTVTGAEGENLDAKPTKKKKAAKKPTIDSLFAPLLLNRKKTKSRQQTTKKQKSPLPRSVVASRRRNWRLSRLQKLLKNPLRSRLRTFLRPLTLSRRSLLRSSSSVS